VVFAPLPAAACWQHRGARSGFEVSYFESGAGGWRFEGTTAAIEDARSWIVSYSIGLDAAWRTRRALITARTASGLHEAELACDQAGRWSINGQRAAHLDGCLDVDLESSALTNTLPVHRLDLAAGDRAETPAAYVRALDLSVERLEQTYTRLPGEAGRQRYLYAAPAFDFTCTLSYDESGLVLDYPGIAVRARLPAFLPIPGGLAHSAPTQCLPAGERWQNVHIGHNRARPPPCMRWRGPRPAAPRHGPPVTRQARRHAPPASTGDPREMPVSRLLTRPGVAPRRFPFPAVRVFLLLSWRTRKSLGEFISSFSLSTCFPQNARSYPHVTVVIHRLMHRSSTGYAT
jgi:hypothetical protein